MQDEAYAKAIEYLGKVAVALVEVIGAPPAVISGAAWDKASQAAYDLSEAMVILGVSVENVFDYPERIGEAR